MQEGRPCASPAAASAAGVPEGPARAAACAAARQEAADRDAAQAAAAMPAAPATPTAQRLRPGYPEPAKDPMPAAGPPQQAGAAPARAGRGDAGSDSDISIGMWDLPPGPPREGLAHVAVKLEAAEHLTDTDLKQESTLCIDPPQVRLLPSNLPNAHSLSTHHVCAGGLLTAIHGHSCQVHHQSLSAHP